MLSDRLSSGLLEGSFKEIHQLFERWARHYLIDSYRRKLSTTYCRGPERLSWGILEDFANGTPRFSLPTLVFPGGLRAFDAQIVEDAGVEKIRLMLNFALNELSQLLQTSRPGRPDR